MASDRSWFLRHIKTWDDIAELAVVLIVVQMLAAYAILVGPWQLLILLPHGVLFCTSWFANYRGAVDWAGQTGIQLESVSPRLVLWRKGRFSFLELIVNRISTVEGRCGWLVAYQGGRHERQSPFQVHWDDTSHELPANDQKPQHDKRRASTDSRDGKFLRA